MSPSFADETAFELFLLAMLAALHVAWVLHPKPPAQCPYDGTDNGWYTNGQCPNGWTIPKETGRATNESDE